MYDGTLNQLNLSVFATYSNDNYTYLKAMQKTNKDKFIDAMVFEVAVHKELDHWAIVTCSSLSVGEKTIRSIWSFKRKRLPDGSQKKSIICSHGGIKRWGENFWET